VVETILFYFLAALLLGLGLLVITRTNPIASAISLVGVFASLAGLYAMQSAPLAAILQILVYAGGIMVLMLFVIMLLNLPAQALEPLKSRASVVLLSLFVLAALFGVPLTRVLWNSPQGKPPILSGDFGEITGVAGKLFSDYLFPFEALSLLLLAAVVGALVLVKKKL
jgi:NADH-quinone oxidoreductase subunit J